MKIYDSVVIGGGPAGMTAALYLLRSGAEIAWVEKLSPGGQVLMTEEIENYPGFPEGIQGWQLSDTFAKHLEGWKYDKYSDEASLIEAGEKYHTVHIGDETIGAKTIVLCSGSRYTRLNLPGETEFTGKGVSYCALCDGNFYRDQVIAVIGGGNSALEESLYLSKIVKKLYLIHRRDDFRGAKCYQDKCFIDPKMEILRSHVVSEIKGDQSGVNAVSVEDLKTGEHRDLDVTGVFIFVGFEPVRPDLPESVTLDDKGFVVTDCEMRTSVPGIFAAGDIRSKLCRQVSTAVGDGATAANAAFVYLEQLDA